MNVVDKILVGIVGAGMLAAIAILALPAESQSPVRRLQMGPFVGASASGAASTLQVFNTGARDGTLTVQMTGSDGSTGVTTIRIPARATAALSLASIQAAASPSLTGAAPNVRFQLSLSADFTGEAQNLMQTSAAGVVANLSACGASPANSGRNIANVSPGAVGQTHTVIFQNAVDRAQTARFDVFRASDGARLGVYPMSVPATAAVTVATSAIAQAVSAGAQRFNLILNADFVGFAQYIIDNATAGVVADMTEACALQGPRDSGLARPALPAQAFLYADADVPLPAHDTKPNATLGNVARTDNTPAANPITNAGAALGRVLFYDQALSANNTVSCASCHRQQFGFSDPNRLSAGFSGGQTRRHSMSLANARYYLRGRFFWDERAATLEQQVLMPIQDSVEMGLTLTQLVSKVAAEDYYPALFQAAFGTPEITADRIARALAQFVRAMVSTSSRLDQAFNANGTLNLAALTPQERQGLRLFGGVNANQVPGRSVNCNQCHTTSAVVSDTIHNNGLDANTTADQGAGQGRFKSPSLRNIAVTAPYMHDGRFATLEQVVEFYNSGIQAHPNLDNRLRTGGPNGQPERLNLSQAEKDALIAFMRTLTDTMFLTDPRLGNPFSP